MSIIIWPKHWQRASNEALWAARVILALWRVRWRGADNTCETEWKINKPFSIRNIHWESQRERPQSECMGILESEVDEVDSVWHVEWGNPVRRSPADNKWFSIENHSNHEEATKRAEQTEQTNRTSKPNRGELDIGFGGWTIEVAWTEEEYRSEWLRSRFRVVSELLRDRFRMHIRSAYYFGILFLQFSYSLNFSLNFIQCQPSATRSVLALESLDYTVASSRSQFWFFWLKCFEFSKDSWMLLHLLQILSCYSSVLLITSCRFSSLFYALILCRFHACALLILFCNPPKATRLNRRTLPNSLNSCAQSIVASYSSVFFGFLNLLEHLSSAFVSALSFKSAELAAIFDTKLVFFFLVFVWTWKFQPILT